MNLSDNDKLRMLVAEGRESGAPVDGEAALKDLREKYAAMAAERVLHGARRLEDLL